MKNDTLVLEGRENYTSEKKGFNKKINAEQYEMTQLKNEDDIKHQKGSSSRHFPLPHKKNPWNDRIQRQ